MTNPLLVSLILAAYVTAAGQEEAESTRSYDVRGLQASAGDGAFRGVDLRLHLSSAFLDELEPDSMDVRREAVARLPQRGDGWKDLFLGVLGESWETGTFAVSDHEGTLRIRANEATHAEIDRILAILEAQALRQVRIEVFAFGPDAVASSPRAVLSADEVDALLESASPIALGSGLTSPGRTVWIGDESPSALLYDYDVEVAQGAFTADPQVTVVQHGAVVGVLVTERSDGGLVLRAWGRSGAVTGVRDVSLDGLGGAVLQLPTMTTALAVGSAHLASGGGVLLGQGLDGGGAWLVRATLEGERPEACVPLGEPVTQSLVVAPPRLGSASPSGGWHDYDYEELAQIGQEPTVDPDQLFDELLEVRERLALDGTLAFLGNAVLVRGDALRAHVAELLASGERSCPTGTVEVDVRVGRILSSDALAVTTGASAPALLAESLDHRLLGSCRWGDTLLLVGGRESFYLQDFDVEIAEHSAIGDPIVEVLFEGASFWCRPLPARAGGHLLWSQLEWREPAGVMDTAPVVAWVPQEGSHPERGLQGRLELAGALDVPAMAHGRLDGMLKAPDGEWVLLGCEELEGTGFHLAAVASVRQVAP